MALTINKDTIIKQVLCVLTVFGVGEDKNIEGQVSGTESRLINISQEPIVLYRLGTIRWNGGKERTIKLSSHDWRLLKTPRKVTVSWLEEKISNYLPECKMRRGIVEKHEVLLIKWPEGLSIEINDSEELKENERKSMSKTRCILTVLSKKPEWIGTQITSSRSAFSQAILLGFTKKNIVIFEGKDATYGIKDGLKYSEIKSKRELVGNGDCFSPIKHNKGFEQWEKDLEKMLDS